MRCVKRSELDGRVQWDDAVPLEIDRNKVVQGVLAAFTGDCLFAGSVKKLVTPIEVTFTGESAIDGGGVTEVS